MVSRSPTVGPWFMVQKRRVTTRHGPWIALNRSLDRTKSVPKAEKEISKILKFGKKSLFQPKVY